MWCATYPKNNMIYTIHSWVFYMHVHCPSCPNTFINLVVQNPWLGLTSMTTTNLPTLAFPSHSKLHPIFHVSCLKKVIGTKCQTQTNLPELDEEGSIFLQPQVFLYHHERRLCHRTIKEVLVHWKDTTPTDATWEPTTMLLQQMPLGNQLPFCSNFHISSLEDKVVFKGEDMLGS